METLKKFFKYQKMYVHSNVFHADDILCVAIGKALNQDMTYERVIKVPEIICDNEIVCDIGGGKYDHHQADSYIDKNGHKFAACELLWRDTRSSFEAIYGTVLAEIIDEIAYEIGLGDNGEEYSPIYKMFHTFNPCWNESKTYDDSFDDAVIIMLEIITSGQWDIFVNSYLERAKIWRESTALANIIDEAFSKMENGIVDLTSTFHGTTFDTIDHAKDAAAIVMATELK